MSQFYELSQIREQNGKNGNPIWIIIKDSVYDVTKFVDDHPGGADLILEYAGKDATKAFNSAGHSSDAVKDLKAYKIGEVVIQNAPTKGSSTNGTTTAEAKAAEAQSQQQQTTATSGSSSKLFCCC